MSLRLMLDCVRAFHEKMDVSHEQKFPTGESREALRQAGFKALRVSELLEEHVCDGAFLRSHLHLEETAEGILALAKGDEVQYLDALADLLYVLLGTAVMYDLPIEEAFAEVHLSNMSKEKQEHDPSKERVRDKGPNYRPPDIAGVLKRYRERPKPKNLISQITSDCLRVLKRDHIDVRGLTHAQRAQLEVHIKDMRDA